MHELTPNMMPYSKFKVMKTISVILSAPQEPPLLHRDWAGALTCLYGSVTGAGARGHVQHWLLWAHIPGIASRTGMILFVASRFYCRS